MERPYCRYCGDRGEADLYGTYCEACDTVTPSGEGHRFRLFVESQEGQEENVKKERRLRRQLSPLRYPGGKSKVIDRLYQSLEGKTYHRLISPFTGGGSFELAMLEAGIVSELVMNDLDTGVYSFWWTVLHQPDALIHRIQTVNPTHTMYWDAQRKVLDDCRGLDLVEAAWATLVVNRLAFSGIAKANPLGGRQGTKEQLLTRWNPDTLIGRIEKIATLADRITVTRDDAHEVIEEGYWGDNTLLFVDPPYVKKGAALYARSYGKREHVALAVLLDSLHRSHYGADILLTYDQDDWLTSLYEEPEIVALGRSYSIKKG